MSERVTSENPHQQTRSPRRLDNLIANYAKQKDRSLLVDQARELSFEATSVRTDIFRCSNI